MNWMMMVTALDVGSIKKIKPLNSSSLIGRQSPNSSAWYPSLTTWCYKTLAHLSNLALQITSPCLPLLLPSPNPYIFFTHGSWPRCPLTFPLTQGAQLSSQGLMKPSRLNPPPFLPILTLRFCCTVDSHHRIRSQW